MCMDKSIGFGSEIENFPTLLQISLVRENRSYQLDVYNAPEVNKKPNYPSWMIRTSI